MVMRSYVISHLCSYLSLSLSLCNSHPLCESLCTVTNSPSLLLSPSLSVELYVNVTISVTVETTIAFMCNVFPRIVLQCSATLNETKRKCFSGTIFSLVKKNIFSCFHLVSHDTLCGAIRYLLAKVLDNFGHSQCTSHSY